MSTPTTSPTTSPTAPSAGAVRAAKIICDLVSEALRKLGQNTKSQSDGEAIFAAIIDRETRANPSESHISPWRAVDKHGEEVARFSSEDEARLYAEDTANGCAGYERTPTPADLTPEQIADELQALSTRMGLSVRVGCQPEGWVSWQVSHHMPDMSHRSGFGDTMHAAHVDMLAKDFHESSYKPEVSK